MNLLELFSGTGSVGKVAKEFGYSVVSLDLKNADINTNILDWDYTIYPEGFFETIWASPPCSTFSNIQSCLIGRNGKTKETIIKRIENEGLPILNKTLEIINYFKPRYFFIENPQTGKMKDYLIDLPYIDVDYCMYSDWGYKKPTRIWTNKEGLIGKRCDKKCFGFQNNKHAIKITKGKTTLSERYRIPPKLVSFLLN
jgi:hypothetical protein